MNPILNSFSIFSKDIEQPITFQFIQFNNTPQFPKDHADFFPFLSEDKIPLNDRSNSGNDNSTKKTGEEIIEHSLRWWHVPFVLCLGVGIAWSASWFFFGGHTSPYEKCYDWIRSSLPNVKVQRWQCLARSVPLGAQIVTSTYIRCNAWLGSVFIFSVF
jgi:hypothetical protein